MARLFANKREKVEARNLGPWSPPTHTLKGSKSSAGSRGGEGYGLVGLRRTPQASVGHSGAALGAAGLLEAVHTRLSAPAVPP